MEKNQDVTSLRFGAFELQPAERRLLMNGQSMPIGPRAFDVLVVLVERAGRLVTKGELLDLAWPNVVVEENNLQVQVWALRKILGTGAIATVPGHGYRFTLDPTREAAAPAVSTSPPKHNLPQQVTSFVGRDRELAEIDESLEDTRLLTLVGFGGIGKTRMALQAGADMVDYFADGVWFVELAALTDPRLVPQAVASVFGVREEAGRPVLEALLKYVKGRQLLLILDNCEHLQRACAELADQLLQSAPQLKILATSRERLNVASETTYPVRALSMPEPNQAITPAALTRYEAVRMFIDRAVTAQPAFRLTEQNATSVVAICERVDGIPLAIELAAARMRALSVEKLAELLSDRFRLLTRGDPTAAARHQTLHALIDWSYDLLTEHERALLRRLAVFAGGWTLEAAEAVGVGGELKAADVLDLLTELVEKSLVVLEADGERYRMLDTVHEYARSRLNELDEGDRARAHHLAFYLAFAEMAWPKLVGPESEGWFTRLDLERENFLAAHAWCGRTGGAAELGLRLVFALADYWLPFGRLELGYRLTTEAVHRVEAQGRTLDRCRALCAAAQLAYPAGRYVEAQACLEESVSIGRELGNEPRIAYALRILGVIACSQGRLADARGYIDEAIALARRLGQKLPLAASIAALAELNRLEEDLDGAEPLYQESLTLARELGDLADIIVSLLNLASVSITRGSSEQPRGMLLEALMIVEEIGSKPHGANVLEVSAALAASSGEWERAGRLCGAADAQLEQLGIQREPVDEAFLSPLMAQAREALGAKAFAAADAAGRALSYDTALAEARAWLREVSTAPVGECVESSRNEPAQ